MSQSCLAPLDRSALPKPTAVCPLPPCPQLAHPTAPQPQEPSLTSCSISPALRITTGSVHGWTQQVQQLHIRSMLALYRLRALEADTGILKPGSLRCQMLSRGLRATPCELDPRQPAAQSPSAEQCCKSPKTSLPAFGGTA